MGKRWLWDALARCDHHLGVSRQVEDTGDVVLMYHSVGDSREYGNLSVERFERDVAYFDERYDVVPLPELRSPDPSRKRVALTFDDGYANFDEVVRPVLAAHDVPATVYLVANAVAGAAHDLDATRTMDRETAVGLLDDDLVTVGNHTMTHPYLSTLDAERCREEVVGARERLEALLGTDVEHFAYPSGDYDAQAVSLVRESHRTGVTTVPAVGLADADPHLLPRIDAFAPEWYVRWMVTDLSARLHDLAASAGLLNHGVYGDPSVE